MDAEKKQLKNLYRKLIENENSVLFAIDKINARVLHRLKNHHTTKIKCFISYFKS